MQCTKYNGYIPLEKTPEMEGLNKSQEINIQFLPSGSPPTPRTLSSYTILSIESVQNIALGEEMLVNYGKK